MKLGRYQCTDQIGGSGGFETYRARVKGLAGDRTFAVKVLRLKRSEVPAAVSEPFLQAARRSAMLADTRIARVVEADSGEGLAFAVTPFMEGADLAQVLQRAREAGVLATGKGEAALRWHALVAYVGAEIARGLQAVHALEPPFIHGALCPGNVFITSRGAVRLLDFGLRASVRRPFEPRPRPLVPFIAPELAAPAADCTAAGDMYSLGVLLCELSIGELPPQGRRPFELQIALSQLPEDLGLLIGRLVSVSPAARPAAAEVVSSLAAVYADTAEAALVAELSSLVQGPPSDAPEESESVVSWDDAPDEVDDAPPPPSEVEHDDAYGFEESLHPRSSEPSGPPPPGQPADRSAPLPSLYAELGSSRDVTTVGEPALIDDLVAQSRPVAPATSTNVARMRPRPPPPPGPRAALPAIVPPAAPAASPASRGRNLTMIAFGSTGTAALSSPSAIADPASESSSVDAEGWELSPPSGPAALVAPTSSVSAPAPDSATLQEEPSGMQDEAEVMLPSPSTFDPPPASWGARALAALGGQAGIESLPGGQPTGLGLLDDVQVEEAEPPVFAAPQPSSRPGVRDSRPFALYGAPATGPALAEAYPLEVGPDGLDSEDENQVTDLAAQPRAEQSRGGSLLEDELVDSPDGARMTSPWAPVGASETDGLPGPASGGFDDQPLPEAVTLLDDQSASVAEAVAFSEDDADATPEAEAYLDDGAAPAAAAAFIDDSGQPLPESEIPVLPEPAAPRGSRPLPPAPPSSLGDLGQGRAVRRPAQEQASVPAWANSPEELGTKHRNRRFILVIAGSVLAASVVAGGLGGLFVGARGRPWSVILGFGRVSAPSLPQAVPPLAPEVADEVTALASPPSDSEAKAKSGTRRAPPAIEEARSAAKKAGADKTALVATPDKKALPVAGAAPATLTKGVADSASAGSLVTLVAASQPAGANVWINGKERGRTPLQVKIQSGPAHVVLVLAGYTSAAVDVTASEGTKVSKELVAVAPPMTGDARFRAECTTRGKLPIVVDGKETGILCPFTKLRVEPGVHKIGLFVPALGEVHEKEVTLHPGVRSIVFGD
jgi:hypothetical protein